MRSITNRSSSIEVGRFGGLLREMPTSGTTQRDREVKPRTFWNTGMRPGRWNPAVGLTVVGLMSASSAYQTPIASSPVAVTSPGVAIGSTATQADIAGLPLTV